MNKIQEESTTHLEIHFEIREWIIKSLLQVELYYLTHSPLASWELTANGIKSYLTTQVSQEHPRNHNIIS